jgi:hypothetical protein
MEEDELVEGTAIVDRAFYNSYRIITDKISFEDLLDEDHNMGNSTLLTYDPEEILTVKIIQDIIDYYIDLEEYEMCAELKKVMDEKFSV